MRQIPAEELDAAAHELDRVRESWIRRPGVSGVDIGYRLLGDRLTDELAIRVHVRPAADPGPLPDRLGPFPVNVIRADYAPQEEET